MNEARPLPIWCIVGLLIVLVGLLCIAMYTTGDIVFLPKKTRGLVYENAWEQLLVPPKAFEKVCLIEDRGGYTIQGVYPYDEEQGIYLGMYSSFYVNKQRIERYLCEDPTRKIVFDSDPEIVVYYGEDDLVHVLVDGSEKIATSWDDMHTAAEKARAMYCIAVFKGYDLSRINTGFYPRFYDEATWLYFICKDGYLQQVRCYERDPK